MLKASQEAFNRTQMMKRRHFINAGLVSLGSLGLNRPSIALSPATHSSQYRPDFSHGISSGDVHQSGATLWSRSTRAAKLWVDVSSSENFKRSIRFSGGAALAGNDFNSKLNLRNLEAGKDWFYRVQFESLEQPGVFSDFRQGHFKTANQYAQDIRFCWSGDTAGQGYGIDPSRGGMKTYSAIADRKPDFFIHCGDLIYADAPIDEHKTLADGSQWNNITAEAVSKVAESTQEFRENFYYNFLDPQVRDFHAQVPTIQQWDDHEVVNNWYPGELLHDDDRYTVKSASLLAERSRQALLQCNPIAQHHSDSRQLYRKFNHGPLLEIFCIDMRSYRGPNSRNRQRQQSSATAFLGDKQLQWLQQSLAQSKATWKIIASDMPIGLMVQEWQTDTAENAANGDGPALGRELEIAQLLSFVGEQKIHNVHFITADVHYCASHHYQPKLAQYKNFKPFWEFVSGPLHAGSFGPNTLDNTFGPEEVFKGIPADLPANTAPSEGYQFFGEMNINADSKTLTVNHFNRDGKLLWSKELTPENG